MRRSSFKRDLTFSKRRTKSSSSKPKPPFPSEGTVIWYNLAFISDEDERSSLGSNTILSSPMKENNKSSFFNMHVTEEELRIKEELGKEIEKELEREIMEGILVLVHRLSDLKAKQITRGLKNSHLDHFLSEIYSSNCCSLCKVGGDVSSGYTSITQWSPRNNAFRGNVREQVYDGSDMESTTENWSYNRKKMERGLSS